MNANNNSSKLMTLVAALGVGGLLAWALGRSESAVQKNSDGPGSAPKPPSHPLPPKPTPDPVGPVEPRPWLPEPYDTFERGPYTVDLTGLTGEMVRWRIWLTEQMPETEIQRNAVTIDEEPLVWSEVATTDDEAREAADALLTALLGSAAESGPYKWYSDDSNGGPFRVEFTATSAGVRWRVFGPDAVSGDGELAPGAMPLGGGHALDESEARAAADAFIGALPHVQGPAELSGSVRHGLEVSPDCRTISVVEPVEWVAWSSRRLAVAARSLPPADAVGKVFRQGWPGCDFDLAQLEVAGRPMAEAIAEVAPTLEAIREGKAFASTDTLAPAAIERAAATLVGVELGRHAAPAFPYVGWIVRLRRAPIGWRWQLFRPGASQPTAIGSARTEKGAIRGAKTRAREFS